MISGELTWPDSGRKDLALTIDPRHLRHLLAIHEEGSLGRAAEALGVSQPALSNSISVLERRLGGPVLTRTGRGAVANEYGEILVRRGRELRSLLDGAEREVVLRRRGQLGPLAIGATPSLIERMVPDALNQLRNDGSNLSISVVEGLDGPLNQMLLDGELDLVVGAVGQPNAPPELDEEHLLDDLFVLGVGFESPLAGRSELSLADAVDELWVLPRPGGSAYTHVQAIFLNAGVTWPADCINTNSSVLTRRLISQSDAVGLINSLAVLGWEAPIHCVRVNEAGVRHVGVRRRRERELSVLAERFLHNLREVGSHYSAASPSEFGRRPVRAGGG